jgi:serine/threonine protein phosphatase PrpC
VRSFLLRGREFTQLACVDCVSEGPAGIAISRGGAAKTYEYTDPNEDAAAFCFGEAATVLAVADGHRGFLAAEVALEHLLEGPAHQWADEVGALGPESWTRHALAALCDANDQVLRERVGSGTRAGARTTLVIAVWLPSSGVLLHVAIGDSHLFVVEGSKVRELMPAGHATSFLGQGVETPESLTPRCRIGVTPLPDAKALVLATDGLSEEGIGLPEPAEGVASLIDRIDAEPATLRPLALARAVCQLACDAHKSNASGDNVAAAVCWLR